MNIKTHDVEGILTAADIIGGRLDGRLNNMIGMEQAKAMLIEACSQFLGKPKAVYMCRLPEIGGYGIEAFGRTAEEAKKAAKKVYRQMKADFQWDDDNLNTFDRAMDYFGGNTRKIDLPSGGNDGECGEEV